MTQLQQPAGYGDVIAAQASDETRADFIRKTYLHLAGAIICFIGIELIIFQTVDVAGLTRSMIGGWMWLIVLGLFMVVSWIARSWADSTTSVPMQYTGLGLYVVAQAVIFVPLLYLASELSVRTGGSSIIGTAAIGTLLTFGALTGFVMLTGKDFSFLGGILCIGGIAALVVIVASIIIGFSLGIVFTVLMIALACGYILYDTSNVMHHYRIGQHVAASLALFASVALLFWYAIRLVMYLQSEE
ncbi:MAG: permease [Phycisphaeraceae bacterium]|nr:permease [Phycisphaeraceae bacterium]